MREEFLGRRGQSFFADGETLHKNQGGEKEEE